ncbi:GntR family transcriptional regulator [Streptomyces sp. CA-249302]|uniref:GntR family transcriptional regulator n=1 Tax=Streptomyces sp. CA-249302 TaxID=3240058 RepID=UPI003D8CDACC
MSGVPLKHQRITEVLAKEIRSGRRPAGEQLPGEHALAQRFGVSRTTVRAALAELCEAGLIATRTGKGSYVLFVGRSPDDSLGWARATAPGASTRSCGRWPCARFVRPSWPSNSPWTMVSSCAWSGPGSWSPTARW